MRVEERVELVSQLEGQAGVKRRMLGKVGVARSTYYRWRRKHLEGGPGALERARPPKAEPSNRLRAWEEAMILIVAEEHPEESARLLAFRITDSRMFSVSEPTVFRVLKKHEMIRPRPAEEQPAAKEYAHKTSEPNEMWQGDGSEIFVPHHGKYKWIPALDDFSRKVLAHKVKPDENWDSINDVLLEAIQKTGVDRLPEGARRPKYLSDNGTGFRDQRLEKSLGAFGIEQIHGRSHHPQTQGKVERLNRRIKEEVNLLVYESPEALQRALDAVVERYNETPHESLNNVSPNDVYAGRREEVLGRRAETKARTLESRKQANRALAAGSN